MCVIFSKVAVLQVLRDPRKISKIRVDITISITPPTAAIDQLSFSHQCLLNGHPGKATPVNVFEHIAEFSCEVHASFPFDCTGNVLEVGVEAAMEGNLQCRSQSNLQVGICLDHQTGNGLIQPLGVQESVLPSPHPSPFQCNTVLPTIELLQIQPDDADIFVAILDAAVDSPQSQLAHIQIIHSCSSNGQPGILSTLKRGHKAANVFSCTLRIAWPYSCESNFIEFGAEITDTSQVPPCTMYAGKRFSYCLDSRNGAVQVLGTQDVVFPVVRAQQTGTLGYNSLHTPPHPFTSYNTQVPQCPVEDLVIEIIQLRTVEQQDAGFVLNAVVRTLEGATVQPQCFINGISGRATLGQQTSNAAEIICEVVAVDPFSCGENLVSVFVNAAIHTSFTVCRQSGGLQISICLTAARQLRVFEQLEISRASILQPFIISGQLGLSFFRSDQYRDGYSHHSPSFQAGKWRDQKSSGHPVSSYGNQQPSFQHKSYSYQFSGIDDGSSAQARRRGLLEIPYPHHDGFFYQKSSYSSHHGPHLPACADVNSGLEISVQQVQPDPRNFNLVTIDALIITGGDSQAGQGQPIFGCSLDGRDGTVSSITSVTTGVGFVCTVETHNPFSCEVNIVRLFAQGVGAPSRIPCEANLSFR